MYNAFYGFVKKPFSLLAETEFLYLGQQHKLALNLLEYGLSEQTGFIVISGEIGSGKTLLVRKILQSVGGDVVIGLITNPHSAYGEVMTWVTSAFDITVERDDRVFRYERFVEYLIQQYVQSRRCVLIVDEAQNLSLDALEELRMLSNVNSGDDFLLQTILVGQPQLLTHLKSPDLVQLVQRVGISFHLEPLSLPETREYIHHRLAVAGGDVRTFDDVACAAVHYFTEGVPRLINMLCDLSLVYGYAEDKKQVGVDIVIEVARARQASGLGPFRADPANLSRDELKATIEAVLDELLPEAFATVKEATRRLQGKEIEFTGTKATWDMIPYDVQLIGGIALHQGKAAEMATGEGKTLVATMPLYLNALSGRGAHLVTVNTYLAQRDAEWMGTVYEYLGLTVDVIDLHQPGTPERRAAYHADITYGTNNEFGFDYLRDNMVHSLEQRVQRRHNYVIIDEVDSILIDEARTPLIISGPVGEERSEIYGRYNGMVASLHRKQTRIVSELIAEAEQLLEEGKDQEAGDKLLAAKRGGPKNKKLLKMFADDPGLQKLVQQTEALYMRDKSLHEIDEYMLYAMDEKGHNVHLSDAGLDELSPNDPDAFLVPDISVEIGEIEKDDSLELDEKRERIQTLEREFAEKSQKIHAIHQLLKAYTLFHKDEQYIIEDGSVVIVDEFTGRKMAGRRWSDGLHQAVEAKEGVSVRGETQTLATITIQNYFRMYDKLAGMTGTAETEEGEFHQIYGLDVMVIPTNRPVIRDDRHDLIYKTIREKYNAMMDEIERLHRLELPILVGTVEAAAGRYNALAWELVRAPDGLADGAVILMEGRATKDDVTLPFRISLDEESAYVCGDFVGDERKGILQAGETADLEATFHFDHLFGDGSAPPDADINTGALGFEPFAALAQDGRVDVDMAALQAGLSAEDYAKLTAMHLAHVGEGHCRNTHES